MHLYFVPITSDMSSMYKTECLGDRLTDSWDLITQITFRGGQVDSCTCSFSFRSGKWGLITSGHSRCMLMRGVNWETVLSTCDLMTQDRVEWVGLIRPTDRQPFTPTGNWEDNWSTCRVHLKIIQRKAPAWQSLQAMDSGCKVRLSSETPSTVICLRTPECSGSSVSLVLF